MREGMTVVGRDGQAKVHPLLAVERNARQAFLSAVRTLGLELRAVSARKKKLPRDDRLRPWDDRPISYERWVKHKDQIMASTRAGSRPEEWWAYEKQMPQPCDLGDERITLFEMASSRAQAQNATSPPTGTNCGRGQWLARPQHRSAGRP